ncbi:hypothetical protein ACFQ8S_06740 [Streptomyces virginiae]|uniref:hypothetical protein n=1 Tax=Streptomyces virginiae TaxID=1961 RepID=UPI0036887A5B
MKITWAIEDQGSGQAVTESVDQAAEALTAAVRESFGDADTGTLAHIMLNIVAPVRAQLVTSGRFEVERGRTWEYTDRGISVTLSPN